MLIPSLFLASAAIVAAQSHSLTSTRSTKPTGTIKEPCGIVASLVAHSAISIPAQTAFKCLHSVPVDVQGDEALIDELKIVWQWQSEIGWLKNTPEDWEYGPLDIEAELDKIKENLNSFSSEYAVQLAIQNITTRTGNYHFNYAPDILQVFSWTREIGVVSLSDDGKSLPKLYVSLDAIQLAANSSNSKVSEITKINGEKPYDHLKKIAAWEQYIDTDGRLNNLFYKGDTQTLGAFARQTQYDGPSTKLKFANGTSKTFDNFASTSLDFDGVTDGKSFFDAFCQGAVAGTASDANAKSVVDPKTYPGRLFNGPRPRLSATYHLRKRQIPSTYPDAVVEAKSGAIAGYFLKGDDYDDVAVLKIITFDPDGDEIGNEFQAVVKKFLAECVKQKKQKLIIDLRENGGGATNLLIDTFMQIFPKEEAFSGQRYRAQEQFTKIGDAVSEIHNDAKLNDAYKKATNESLEDTYRYWAYYHFVTAEGETFKDWKDFEGPTENNSDNFTTTMRYNYSNSDEVSIRPAGFFFVNSTDRPTAFEAKNVVMFTDALCGSSCASFHEELKNIAGVKAVTVGGRPENKPIQTVTGTKGGEVIPLHYYPLFAEQMLNATEEIGATTLSDSKVNDLAKVTQVKIRAGDGYSRMQIQDQIRKGDTTATPLQYIYEASDCKIFYTPDTYADPDAAWKQAWDAFSDDAKCVEGSTGHKSSISGGYKPFGPGELQDDEVRKPSNTTNGTNPSGTPTPPGPSAPSGTGAASSLKAGSAAFAVVVMAAAAMW